MTGTTYGTLGQGTYVIGGETFVHDQGATLTDDQIAYLTQNPGSTQTNTPQAVLASDQYQMTQENFVENVVLDSGALDVVAGSQDYELIYTMNGEWTPTQQGLFDTAMVDALAEAFGLGEHASADEGESQNRFNAALNEAVTGVRVDSLRFGC